MPLQDTNESPTEVDQELDAIEQALEQFLMPMALYQPEELWSNFFWSTGTNEGWDTPLGWIVQHDDWVTPFNWEALTQEHPSPTLQVG
ncbi:hypothetical protein GUITHDRAFT_118454 [Guillardia theta CCMP2712]|uniref:Uncharacterized protein n=1 Tax=Guillardia theta (strain CCMP2712) TaxID=905079 RepID=L1IHQ1_GUITC|nr:hypothetical protein GUITHDRAFT_118454 [Guillardia theta CCMP2712]EKX35330.1 hypothetical protein GUITHDRAFT_118454 [Guillardia theta CCMP2712]|mmetsp:Transcript_27982/g.90787  ORF Transcript_27982/g.90787 Transcript_27982/m.90787 type:complete len:88 (+) Transcript_27982:155-418(+)|eukprot:XP_005822310.1 hypothetical protein GUITHDRAFT_118454 [Guillardia theta CCMP2712]